MVTGCVVKREAARSAARQVPVAEQAGDRPAERSSPDADQNSGLPGVRRKPLDNPVRPKPVSADDEVNASRLINMLRRVPHLPGGNGGAPLRLLEALCTTDRDLARELVVVAALTHRAADERRTAEYLLRHRARVTSCETSALALLRAARRAADQDVRDVFEREIAVPNEDLALQPLEMPASRVDDPSVGEMVLDKLRAVAGHDPTRRCEEWVRDAVVIAFELAARHSRRRGGGPSLLAMRADARPEARLVSRLRAEFESDAAAGRIARLLVGADSSPIETALLWWCAQKDFVPVGIPAPIRDRWRRDLRAADAYAASGNVQPPPAARKCRPAAAAAKSPTCSPSSRMALSRGR